MRRTAVAAMIGLAALSTALPARSRRQVAEDQLRGMIACSAIAEVAQRVACYDAAARQVMAANPDLARETRSAAAPAPGAPAVATPAAPPAASFGSDNLRSARREPRSDEADRMTQRITSRTEDERGLWSYAFANGQVWETTERTEFNMPRPGQTTTVHRGLMGGYLMDLGGNAQVRVRRVR